MNNKWLWKMNYCKKLGISPARKEAWEQAEHAYKKRFNL